jgi:protein-tyrosine phosphatase
MNSVSLRCLSVLIPVTFAAALILGSPTVHSTDSRPTGEHVRHPPIEGAPNFRDLGGYRTSDGRTVKWGMLYRSDALSNLTERDLQYLAHLKIGEIVDFRSQAEILQVPDKLPRTAAIRQINLPIASNHSTWAEAADENARLRAIDHYLLTDMYPGFVRNFTPAYRTWMHGLLDTPGSAQVFHCMGGADRTGFAAAVFLLTLGVPKDLVMKDYLMSNQLLFSAAGRVYLDSRMEVKLPVGMQLHPQYLRAAFAEMEREYGSIDGYLREGLGIDDDFRQKLRDRYLE